MPVPASGFVEPNGDMPPFNVVASLRAFSSRTHNGREHMLYIMPPEFPGYAVGIHLPKVRQLGDIANKMRHYVNLGAAITIHLPDVPTDE